MLKEYNYDPEQAAEGEWVPGEGKAAARPSRVGENSDPAKGVVAASDEEVTKLPIDPVALQKARADGDSKEEIFPMVEPDSANDVSSDPDYL